MSGNEEKHKELVQAFINKYDVMVEKTPSRDMAIIYMMALISANKVGNFLLETLVPSAIPVDVLYQIVLSTNAAIYFMLEDDDVQTKDMLQDPTLSTTPDKIKFVVDQMHKMIYVDKIFEGK